LDGKIELSLGIIEFACLADDVGMCPLGVS
jgi:hypothetical protein